MLKISLREDSSEAFYMLDDKGKPLAKVQLLEKRGNQQGIGITALKQIKILRNKQHLIDSNSQKSYDQILKG